MRVKLSLYISVSVVLESFNLFQLFYFSQQYLFISPSHPNHMKFPFGKLWLSPMESVSDFGFRKLCYNHGASLTFIEMLYADAIARKNKAALGLVDSYDPAIPTGIQFLAGKPIILRKALESL